MAAPKLFVFGSVDGQLRSAFGRLASLHAKNKFDIAIVSGNLFCEGQDGQELLSLLDGTIQVACPTYYSVGTTALPPLVVAKLQKDDEVAPNLHFLGKHTVTKTPEGVRIAAFGGVPARPVILEGKTNGEYMPFQSEEHVQSMSRAEEVDILLTAIWPSGIWRHSVNYSASKIEQAKIPCSNGVAELNRVLRPRYHFAMSPGDFAFEREPFIHPPSSRHPEGVFSMTRFISLAPWQNASKAKSMFAFSLNRNAHLAPPAGSTITPFHDPQGKKRISDEAGFSRFSSDTNPQNHRHKRPRLPPPGPDQCFFCLSNPNLPAHMICSVGNDAYIATAKGPLPSSDTFKLQGLGFPCHLILAPLIHAPTIAASDVGKNEALVTFQELSRFRDSLGKMIASRSQRKLGTITWVISRSKNIHVHWQCLPVLTELVFGGSVEAGFRVLAEDLKLGTFAAKDFQTADEVQCDYLRVWIWAEQDGAEGVQELSKSLLLPFDASVRFDLQFPRRVMAKLLGLEERTVWQDVNQSTQEEEVDVKAFREAFKEWDFTLEE